MKIATVAFLMLAAVVAGYLAVPYTLFAESPAASPPDAVPAPTAAPGFAVVELFTSQGCSSCPSADRVLQSLHEQAQANEQPVYTLSFHVDYWDGLGWPDPYGSKQATQRQYAYAQASGSSRVYTPQMIVNGRTEFVGSNRAQAERAVRNALATPASHHLTISDVQREGQNITARLTLAGAPKSGSTVLVALVEPLRRNEVARGENRGRELSHAGVVRDVRHVRVADISEAVTVHIPDDAADHLFELIAFVQDGPAGPIGAATARALP